MDAITIIRTSALTILFAVAAGAATTLLLRRLFHVRVESSRISTAPLAERVQASVVRIATDLWPETRAGSEAGREALARSGVRASATTLLSIRLGALAAGVIAATLAWPLVGGMQGLAAAATLIVAGLVAPQLWLMRRRAKWRDEIEAELPNALDLLTISVVAGNRFDQAIRTVAEKSEGALAEEFAQVSAEAQFSSAVDALVRLADRAEVQPLTVFAASLAQAERTGAALVDILREQAQAVRKARRMKVEERVNKLSAKMLIPMILFILPTLIIIILAPVVPVVLEALAV